VIVLIKGYVGGSSTPPRLNKIHLNKRRYTALLRINVPQHIRRRFCDSTNKIRTSTVRGCCSMVTWDGQSKWDSSPIKGKRWWDVNFLDLGQVTRILFKKIKKKLKDDPWYLLDRAKKNFQLKIISNKEIKMTKEKNSQNMCLFISIIFLLFF
jgi:hypothetical protein